MGTEHTAATRAPAVAPVPTPRPPSAGLREVPPSAERPVRAVAPRRRVPVETSPAAQLRVSIVFVLGLAAFLSVVLGAPLAALVCAVGALVAAATVRRTPMKLIDRRLRGLGVLLASLPGVAAVVLLGMHGPV